MHEPTYRNALRESWRLVRHHSVLWALGILAIFSGQLGLNDFLGKLWSLSDTTTTGSAFDFTIFASLHSFKAIVGVVWLLVIVVALIVPIVFMGVAAQGALIAATAEWYHLRQSPDFTLGWHQGTRHFWRLLGISILKKLALFCVLAVVGFLGNELIAQWADGGRIAAAVLLALGLFAGLVVTTVATFTAGYIVVEEHNFSKALRKAWELFSAHALVSLEVSILLLLVNVLVILGVVLLSSLSLVPSLVAVLLAFVTGSQALVGIGFFLSICLFVAIVVFVGGYYNAFATASWMYLFMKMHHEGVVSRVLHWGRRMFDRA